VPFFIFPTLYEAYENFNKQHGLGLSFIKFAVLATTGESLGLRIQKGVYSYRGFGLLPRAIVWGFLGMLIYMAFAIFSNGTPALLEQLGWEDATKVAREGTFGSKLGIAFAISVLMNLIFAPVMMTLHKITDTHILYNNGVWNALFKRMDVVSILKHLNWEVHWHLVLKKTIPLFWIPAHTLTFLLPSEYRVLFAALLGIVLGVILSFANRVKV
jgi:hypothetical protein